MDPTEPVLHVRSETDSFRITVESDWNAYNTSTLFYLEHANVIMNMKRYAIGMKEWFESETAQNYLVYGEVYKDAVKTLIDHFDKNPKELLEHAEKFDDPGSGLLPTHAFGILPLVYNFRHYVELKLKGLILMKDEEIANTHDIFSLLQQLKQISDTKRISKPTEYVIDKLQKCDNRSADAFRYPYDSQRKMHFAQDRDFLDLVNDFDKCYI